MVRLQFFTVTPDARVYSIYNYICICLNSPKNILKAMVKTNISLKVTTDIFFLFLFLNDQQVDKKSILPIP